jgi:serine/threonine protein kinase
MSLELDLRSGPDLAAIPTLDEARRPSLQRAGEPSALGATLEASALALKTRLPPEPPEPRVQLAEGEEEPLPARIGRYVILRLLGQGAMGVVYSAYDPDLDRKVAIKVVRDAAQGRSRGRKRVLQEAQAMARVSHQNVVHVYEVGEEQRPQGARVFIAMEFVPGLSMLKWQEQHPLRDKRSFEECLGLYLQAAAGLFAAHQSGLIHRGTKPKALSTVIKTEKKRGEFGGNWRRP